jgi:plasmid maintenance system antidote protein VapI
MSNLQNLVSLSNLPRLSDSVAKSVELVKTSVLAAPKVRGRKPGVRTVSDAVCNKRRGWLSYYTREPGKKSKLGKMLQAPDSFISHLLAGRRTFTDNITCRIEEVLGLTPGTIDASDVVAATAVNLPAYVHHSEEGNRVLDANLAKVLVDFLNQAILRNQVTNEMAIKILVDITPS